MPVSRSRLARAVACVAFVAGAGVRVEHFLTRRSLWLDEAMLANNVVRRGYGDLLHRLDNDQAAPPGFLWLERLCGQVFGWNEYALRLVPLLAGLALLPLLWWLVQRALGDRAAAGALVFVALSPAAVRYSTEVKQYSSDVLAVLAVLAVASFAAENLSAPRAALFAAVASFAVWLSHPAWFAVAAGGLLLVRTRRVREIAIAGVPVAFSAVVVYAANLRHVRGNDALESYWAGGYPPKSASVFGAIRWVFRAAWSVLDQPGGVHHRIIGLVVILVGVAALRRHAPRLGGGVGVVIAIAFVAAIARVYPVRGRLALYAVPLLAIVLAAGLAFRWGGRVIGLALVILLFAPAGDVLDMAQDPPVFVEGRQAIEYLARHQRAGELVYVHSTAMPVFEFYAPRLEVQADGVVTCGSTKLASAGRAWLLFAYTLSTRPANEQALVGEWFGGGARPVRAFYGEDASARLYELRPAAAPTDACRSLPGPVRK